MKPIYLDYHATTPVDPRVLDVMLPYFTETYGNANSRMHEYGWNADAAVDRARRQVAELIGARCADEIVFTSGATESNNLALAGVIDFAGGGHVITSAIEHASVRQTSEHLGVDVTVVGVDARGLVSPADVEAAVRPDTKLISVMAVNNEIGTVQPLAELGAIARRHGVLFHSDASQAVGRIDVDVEAAKIDLLSLSGHKIYGPKGVGALYVRGRSRRSPIRPRLFGGGQEYGLRSGTLNVPGIVGLGAAAELAHDLDDQRLRSLRHRLLSRLRDQKPRIHGCLERRIAGNLNLSFDGIPADALINAVPTLAISGGAACSSGGKTSHVLRAMGVEEPRARGAVRIGLGRMTTEGEIDHAAEALRKAVLRLRSLCEEAGGERLHQ